MEEEQQMKRMHVQLTEEQYETLRTLAFRDRRSLADVVREAIERYLVDRATKEEGLKRIP